VSRGWNTGFKAAGACLLGLTLMGAGTIEGPKPPTAPTAPTVNMPQPATSESGAPGGSTGAGIGGLSCPADIVNLPLNRTAGLDAFFGYPQYIYYEVEDGKIARATSQGLFVPSAKGTTRVNVTVTGEDGTAAGCSFRLRVVDPSAYRFASSPVVESGKLRIGGRSVYANTVVLPKGMPADIGFGKDAVGFVEPMKKIVERNRAAVAINGTYFSAYGGEPVPYGTLVKDGEVAYSGSAGTMLGIGSDGTARLAEVSVHAEGGTDGLYDAEHRWPISAINRVAGNTMVFTPVKGTRIGLDQGVMIVVSGGKVKKVVENENAVIPRDGFVVVKLRTTLKEQKTKYPVGKKLHYRVTYWSDGERAKEWNDVATAVSSWPLLISGGKTLVKDEKDAQRAARSAVGLTKDGRVVLATIGQVTFGEIAQVLLSKGAVEAMSLDGGASAGIYARGVQLFTPGREISQTLMFGGDLR